MIRRPRRSTLFPTTPLSRSSANQVSDTSRYVANIEPLIHDPAVQNALTDKVTSEITSNLDVTGYVNQAAALLTQKGLPRDRKSTRLNSSHLVISYAVFCLKK